MEDDLIAHVATEYAREHGHTNIDDYTLSGIERDRQVASVLFKGRSGLPGDHFTVLVDLSAGEARELFPGE